MSRDDMQKNGISGTGPAYLQVARALEKRIRSGNYHSTGKLESENELCRLFQHSRPTLRRALNLLVKRGLIKCLPKRGYFLLNTQPQKSSRPRIAVLADVDYEVHSLSPENSLPLRHLHRLGHLHRFHLQHIYESSAESALNYLFNPPPEISGALILRPPRSWVDLLIRESSTLQERGFPFIVIDRNLEDSGLHFISSDFGQPIRDALGYLYQLGHSRVAIIIGPSTDTYNAEILAAYRNNCTGMNLAVDPELVCEVDDYDPRRVSEVIGKFLKLPLRFTGLIIGGEIFLPDTLRYLDLYNVNVPAQLSVIASCQNVYLDNLPLHLTFFQQPVRRICEICFEVMGALLEGRYQGVCQRRVRFPFTFGQSCAPVNSLHPTSDAVS